MPKLKVYRTSTGFHDAYVAAPSQKAALKAWGSEHDLFARGVAAVIDDPALAKEPLAHPGEVIKRLRGTTAEQIAALPRDRPRKKAARADQEEQPAPTRKPATRKEKLPPAPPPKPKPPPARGRLDDAERALAEAEGRHRVETKVLAQKEAALVRRHRKLEKEQAAEVAKLERDRDRAEADYERAMRKWRG
jgi:ribonuclease D